MVLSPKVQRVFGTVDGKLSIHSTLPRWIAPAFVWKGDGICEGVGMNLASAWKSA